MIYYGKDNSDNKVIAFIKLFKLHWLALLISIVFIVDLTITIGAIGTDYYLGFTKSWFNVMFGIFIWLVMFYSNKKVKIITVATVGVYTLIYSIAIIPLMRTFNRLPSTSDAGDFGLIAYAIPVFAFIAIVGAVAIITGYLILKSEKITEKHTSIIAPVFLAFAITTTMMFNTTRSYGNSGTYYSYSAYTQANRDIFGAEALNEWGVFGSMFANKATADISGDDRDIEMWYRDNESDRFGEFQGRNVNVIVVETMDLINMNSLAMPFVTSLYENSFSFENMYVPSTHYVTCRSEFMFVTGKYNPPSAGCAWSNMDTYVDHVAENNMFYNFGQMGYTTEYYHSSGSDFYFRESSIPLLGSDVVNFYGDGRMTDEYRDHEFYDKNIKPNNDDSMKLRYWLTFDGHGIINEDTSEDPDHYNDLLAYHNGDEVLAHHGYRIGYADRGIQAMVEDNPDDIYIIMADHNGYAFGDSVSDAREGLDYYRTPLFIYGNNVEPGSNHTFMSQIDVLPMIYDLFAIPNEKLLGANPLSRNDQFFITATGTYYYKGKEVDLIKFDKNVRNDWASYVALIKEYNFDLIENWLLWS